MAITVFITIMIFATGVIAGTIVAVSWGIRREERGFSLTRQAPDRLSQGARMITGLYVRRQTDTAPIETPQPDIFA